MYWKKRKQANYRIVDKRQHIVGPSVSADGRLPSKYKQIQRPAELDECSPKTLSDILPDQKTEKAKLLSKKRTRDDQQKADDRGKADESLTDLPPLPPGYSDINDNDYPTVTPTDVSTHTTEDTLNTIETLEAPTTLSTDAADSVREPLGKVDLGQQLDRFQARLKEKKETTAKSDAKDANMFRQAKTSFKQAKEFTL